MYALPLKTKLFYVIKATKKAAINLLWIFSLLRNYYSMQGFTFIIIKLFSKRQGNCPWHGPRRRPQFEKLFLVRGDDNGRYGNPSVPSENLHTEKSGQRIPINFNQKNILSVGEHSILSPLLMIRLGMVNRATICSNICCKSTEKCSLIAEWHFKSMMEKMFCCGKERIMVTEV